MTFQIRLIPLLFLFPAALAAQTTGVLNLYPADPAAEQNELNQAVNMANGSSVDLTRVFEQHLRKYPNTIHRADLEATLYKTAVDTNDHARIVIYGEKMLAGKPANELDILDRVTRAILSSDDADSAKKALPYIRRYEDAVQNMRAGAPEGHATAAQWADLADRAFSRATVLEARANGNLGNFDDAVAKATVSWIGFPTAESAHEMAKWMAKAGHESEAIDHYADAVVIDDARSSWSDRDRDRKTLTALYVKIHGSEQGLGDVFLRAWDRTAQAMRDRVAGFQNVDRNYGLTNPFEVVLPAVGGTVKDKSALEMSKLKGKTLVIDFWATWCGPCLAQHPLIEEVKKKYARSPDVVFLSLDADDDHSLVAPFLKAHNWDDRVYLEDGLAGLVNLNSLPTLLVIDPYGKIYSRMTGFAPDLFAKMLTDRIDEARSILPADSAK